MPHRLLQFRLPEPLLAWYRANARDLPWRRTEDPYRIWVSEIMLQQTRVAAVLGYYDRFLAALPTVEALAAAPEEQLMKLWEGLGYYSRARNLQKAAKRIAAGGGQFPDTYEGLLALPGIGDYTASAIASAAFGKREAAVDGNVLRLVMRLTDGHDDIADPRVKKAVRAQVQAVMPETAADIRIFNQATMELGAQAQVLEQRPVRGQNDFAALAEVQIVHEQASSRAPYPDSVAIDAHRHDLARNVPSVLFLAYLLGSGVISYKPFGYGREPDSAFGILLYFDYVAVESEAGYIHEPFSGERAYTCLCPYPDSPVPVFVQGVDAVVVCTVFIA